MRASFFPPPFFFYRLDASCPTPLFLFDLHSHEERVELETVAKSSIIYNSPVYNPKKENLKNLSTPRISKYLNTRVPRQISRPPLLVERCRTRDNHEERKKETRIP